MSVYHDLEFDQAMEKAPPMDGDWQPPRSKLAILSFVFGILGVTVLPLYGSIVAVATGHAALGEIRDSGGRVEGRSLAKVGLGLGYFAIVLALIVGLLVLTYSFVRVEPPAVATPAAHWNDSERGVKMVNEMGREDFQRIEQSQVNIKEDEIIACYNAGPSNSDPEFALLTTRKIVYLKAGRSTAFDLKDVVDLKDDKAFEQAYHVQKQPNGTTVSDFDFETYHIEVRNKSGARMRINIQPEKDGPLFFDALKSAIEGAGAKLNPA